MNFHSLKPTILSNQIIKFFFCYCLLASLLAGCKQAAISNGNTLDERPNIIIIMADDLGFSDVGCYGGEIQTPNIDQLAANGLRFTQFYNAARCCPTRASLLSGQYAHRVGLQSNGQNLGTNGVTIAEALKTAGYQTGMTGKWHLSQTKPLTDKEEHLRWLAHQTDHGSFAPIETYPSNRGFDEHYGVIWGVVNFFDPFSLVHNETPIDEVPEDFYFTDFISDRSVELINQFSQKEAPFFLYVAHAAPHWPLHALPEDIAKYKGRYDAGWDALRQERYERMTKMGLFDGLALENGSSEAGQSWDDCQEKAWEAKHMEAHAAMVDRVDQGIGEIIASLKANGEFKNTLILFLADNGASPERYNNPGYDRPDVTRTGSPIQYPLSKYERPGAEDTWGYIGRGWAGAINAPFRYWKATSFHGGNCTPLVAHWPAGLQADVGSINREVGHVVDILPTCLELAKADYPQNYNGNKIDPSDGKSLLPILQGQSREEHEFLFWEHAGSRALRKGDWKITALKGKEWQLFNLEEDLSETKNLAALHPEKVEELRLLWQRKAEEVGYVAPGR